MNVANIQNQIAGLVSHWLAPKKSARLFPDDTIFVRGTGFLVTRAGETTDAGSWDTLETIVAFKRDLVTTDLICFELWMIDGTLIEVNEEMNGFEDLLTGLEKHVAGFDGKWPDKVVLPAFSPNRTIVFSSGDAKLLGAAVPGRRAS